MMSRTSSISSLKESRSPDRNLRRNERSRSRSPSGSRGAGHPETSNHHRRQDGPNERQELQFGANQRHHHSGGMGGDKLSDLTARNNHRIGASGGVHHSAETSGPGSSSSRFMMSADSRRAPTPSRVGMEFTMDFGPYQLELQRAIERDRIALERDRMERDRLALGISQPQSQAAAMERLMKDRFGLPPGLEQQRPSGLTTLRPSLADPFHPGLMTSTGLYRLHPNDASMFAAVHCGNAGLDSVNNAGGGSGPTVPPPPLLFHTAPSHSNSPLNAASAAAFKHRPYAQLPGNGMLDPLAAAAGLRDIAGTAGPTRWSLPFR